jgi:hypothetical protein
MQNRLKRTHRLLSPGQRVPFGLSEGGRKSPVEDCPAAALGKIAPPHWLASWAIYARSWAVADVEGRLIDI